MRPQAAAIVLLALALAACTAGPRRGGYYQDDGPPGRLAVDPDSVADAVPTNEPPSRYGNKTYTVNGKTYSPMRSARGYRERGVASWYGRKFHGRRTSNGETYDMFAMTAAHRTLPLPSFARVTNLRSGKSVVVRVNDRGPFYADRLIDLSYVAAHRIGVLDTGTALVEVTAITPGTPLESVAPDATQAAQLYLQVGAFSVRANAESLRDRLNAAGLGPAVLQEIRSAGTVLHRVRIGPLASVEEGDALEERVTRHGFTGARLVVD